MSDIHHLTTTPSMVEDVEQQLQGLGADDFKSRVQILYGIDENPSKTSMPIKLLCLYSNFFKKRLLLAASPETPIQLMGQSVSAFNIFLAWNSTQKVSSAKRLPKITDGALPSVIVAEYATRWDALLECYQLADYIEAPNFGNAVIDDMILSMKNEWYIVQGNRTHGWIGTLPYQIATLYAKTEKGSPLRRLVIDWVICNPGASSRTMNVKGEFNEPPAPLDYVAELRGKCEQAEKYQNEPWNIGTCVYHNHANGVSCGGRRDDDSDFDDDDSDFDVDDSDFDVDDSDFDDDDDD